MSQQHQLVEQIFAGNSEMARLMRSIDWAATPVGAFETWSQSLKTSLSICLNSRFPILIWWGHDLVMLYNDAYRSILGVTKHPTAMGQRGQDCWAEIWDVISPMLERVFSQKEATWSENQLLLIDRNGYIEECYFTFSYSPILDDTGQVGGIFTAVTETTQQVIGERQLRTLRELAADTAQTKTVEAACQQAITCLARNPADLPFALLYLLDRTGQRAELVEAIGVKPEQLISPRYVFTDTTSRFGQAFSQVTQAGRVEIITDLTAQFGELPGGIWEMPPQTALILPILQAGQEQVTGLLIVGISSQRALNEDYQGFLELIAGQIATAIANARAYEEERKRAEALAELDHAKTVFFSNVSHEFRTPLTLMLSPLEDIIANLSGTIPAQEREQLQLVRRNGMRLLKLVNSLLDFSRLEAGRVQASYEPVDLATYTAELASAFKSLIEQAGMSLIVECTPLPEAVYVDRDMWEKIVLNLLSNAFKFTLAGTITVRLLWRNFQVELSVADTGTGIPAEELPHLFKRFHRVENPQGRSFEGSGIGLSLVQELVKLHGGTINVTSTFGQGSCFTVLIPTGTAHLSNERIRASRTLASTALGAMSFVEEAQRWLPQNDKQESLAVDLIQSFASESRVVKSEQLASEAHILLVDDNADMRDYIRRLLSVSYTVQTVADGLAALTAIENNRPDLVLTDVMMPLMDGFELLRSLRSNPTTQDISIILLSARAGEESRIEGLEAGADDYLIKPFSARELLARVEASLKLARLRREATMRERIILERVTDAFMALDLDFRFTYANVAAERVSQTPLKALLGRTMWESFPATIGTQFEFQYRRALTEQVAVEFEEYYAPLDLWVEIHVYPSPTGLSLFFRDINDRKRAEAVRLRLAEEREQLLQREQAAREQAETANRIKDEFLAVLSHELRTPLNPILGWATLLKQGKLNAAKTTDALAIIERNAKLQVQLIDDLLDISRILRGKLSLAMQPVDLSTVISAALETVYLAAEAKSLHIQTTIFPSVGLVTGDAGRLQQVVWNLLSNAVKFTPPGGHVIVELTQAGTNAQIRVKDTGKGIQPNFLPYVFEHFRQEDAATTRQFGGLGLGLAISRQIVEMHGGNISVESPVEGQGATFTVQIPIILQSVQIPASGQFSKSALDLSGLKILVVDDEPDSRDFVAFVLEQAGALVTSVSSAVEALQAVEQSVPSLVVSDIGMPYMDGYMLMQQIRALERTRRVPAIALTAYAGEYDQQQAITAGFQQHLTKPVEPEKLVGAISVLCNRVSDSKTE